ncbi:hypothetical protein HKCCA1065_11705 [Rhodobacterales bacterium HKCCA1065]|nr:hypothetical protein [Rhodobacterales bacterium HKCCA1065]
MSKNNEQTAQMKQLALISTPPKQHSMDMKGGCDCDDSAALTARSSRETDDHYVNFVTRLNPRHRVVRCKDDIQWIIQRPDGFNQYGQRWKGVKFCVYPQTLMRLCLTECGICDAAALDVIKNLQFERKG